MPVNVRKNLLARLVTPGGDDPLTLTLVAPKIIRAGTAVSGLALVGQGGAGGYAYSILSGSAYGSLPLGLTLNIDGSITGVPEKSGHYLFFAQVEDSDSTVYVAAFSITVLSRLSAGHGRFLPGEIGLPYAFTFTVTGNTGVVTWAIVSGNLPAGLSLNTATGVVSGTPTADSNGLGGISYFTIRATDTDSGGTDSLDIPWAIRIYESFTYPGNLGITINATIPFEFNPTPSYIGGAEPIMYGASIPDGHDWLTFNRTTRALEGTPGLSDVSATPFDVSFYARDAIGKEAGGTLSITVDPPPQSSIQPQRNSLDIGPRGPINLSFDGAGVSVANDGVTATITIPGAGPGSDGIQSINGATPDSSGNIDFTSPDSSVGIAVNSSGEVELTATAGSSPLTTKGDLYTYGTTDQRLPVGNDNEFLIADKSEPTGLKWVPGTTASQITEFTTPGSTSYSVPANAIYLDVTVIGGGGGGASGGTTPTGTSSGGAGGGGGARRQFSIRVADLSNPSSVPVVVGAGGVGGAGSTAAQCAAGSAGGDSSFDGFVAYAGGAASGAGGAGGGGGGGLASAGGDGGAAAGTAGDLGGSAGGGINAQGVSNTTAVGGSGGAGTNTGNEDGEEGGDALGGAAGGACGGGTSASVSRPGGPGGRTIDAPTAAAGGLGGTNVDGGDGANGVSPTNGGPGGGGAGGGGSRSTGAIRGGHGGDGGRGAGGGGGGGCYNVVAGTAISGDGGNGGNGFVRVVAHF